MVFLLVAASPAYLLAHGEPRHPRDILDHACIRHRFASGVSHPWEFEKAGEIIRISPTGPLISTSIDLELRSALDGVDLIATFEDFVAEDLAAGRLESVLNDWLPPFTGPLLDYPSRRHMPAPLRAFVDFVKAERSAGGW